MLMSNLDCKISYMLLRNLYCRYCLVDIEGLEYGAPTKRANVEENWCICNRVFLTFDLEDSEDCQYDYVEVRKGICLQVCMKYSYNYVPVKIGRLK